MGFEFERVTPEAVGIPSAAILETMKALDAAGIELHTMKLLRHGKVCAEACWAPYAEDIPHALFSLTKSFTSTAIGFAVQEGLLSLDEKLVDLFPTLLPENPSENLKKCTVRHLLMMGCGHETEISNLGMGDMSWEETFIKNEFVYEPGTKFMYNTAGTNMLCAILKLKTGLSLTEFLTPRLYEPLEITGEMLMVTLPDGIDGGGFGYKQTIGNLAKFAQFAANKGSWQGKQLLNAEWFEMAFSKQIRNDDSGNPSPDWQQGYGFQFWRCQPEGVVRGDGAFGQYAIIMQKQDAVLVFNSAEIDMQPALSVIWEKLLPAMADAALPENTEDSSHLRHYLENARITTMHSARVPAAETLISSVKLVPDEKYPLLTTIIGGVGRLKPESGELKSLRFDIAPHGEAFLHVEESEGNYKLNLGMESEFVRTDVRGEPFAANARMRAQNKLEFEIRNLRTLSGTRFIVKFGADKAEVSADSSLPLFGGLSEPPKPLMTFGYEGDTDKMKALQNQL